MRLQFGLTEQVSMVMECHTAVALATVGDSVGAKAEAAAEEDSAAGKLTRLYRKRANQKYSARAKIQK